jgi:hypothetical protein
MTALNSLLELDGERTLVAAASGISKQAIALSATVNRILGHESAPHERLRGRDLRHREPAARGRR